MYLNSLLESFSGQGAKVAFVDPDGRNFSYSEFLAEIKKYKLLLDDAGIQQKVVAVRGDFCAASAALLLALIQNQCIVVPIQKKSKQAAFYLESAACEYLFDFPGAVQARHIAPAPDLPPLMVGLLERKGPGLVLFSSGSTGQPKGILHDLSRLLPSFLKKGKAMNTLALLLFDHVGGLNTLFRSLSAGGTLVCLESRDPGSICRAVENYQVELLPASPTLLNVLLISGMYKTFNLSSLKMITYGTEEMPQTLLEKLQIAFPYCSFKQTYGLSELGILPTKSQKNDSVWMKLGGQDFATKIKNGTLHVKAASSMLGYINAPSPFDEEGWFDTGDKAMEENGYYKIVGRESDIINIGGEKVYPVEIESALMEFFGVLDAKVYRQSSLLTGETVAADILVDKNNDNAVFKKALRTFCSERLERYKIPSKITLHAQNFLGQRLKKSRNSSKESS